MHCVLRSTHRLCNSVVSPVDTSEQGSAVPGGSERSKKWALVRWYASSATLTVPQAAGPVAFSFVALLACVGRVINGDGLGDRAYDCRDCHGSSRVSWMSVQYIG
jgi:hypothetical protein